MGTKHRKIARRLAKRQTIKLPLLLLTLDDAILLKRALVPLDALLETKPASEVQFAHETVVRAQQKMGQMIEQEGGAVSLDGNEMVVLHAAVRLFLVALDEQEDSAEKSRARKHALVLQARLVPATALALGKRSKGHETYPPPCQ